MQRLMITISVVLYNPDLPALERMFASLGTALTDERQGSKSSTQASVVLTDHSNVPLSPQCLIRFSTAAAEGISISYFHDKTNPGFGAGHNRAFKQVVGQGYFLVANPDLVFLPGSLACGVSFLECHEAIGLLAPALYEPMGELRPACFRYPDIPTLMARWMGGGRSAKLSFYYEYRDWVPERVNFDPMLVSGCCMLFRTSVFQRLGGFDAKYFLYFEDFDLSLRAAASTRLAYVPGLAVIHAGGGAGKKGWRHAIMFLRSAYRFFSKHGWRWRPVMSER